ncbi:hypothetical protein MKEN_00223400 [Mycena kentingensis (nom. inval.)]|nr:hypothetical protein MKEN_00223400 [Mycena kentingensis (nom. inval.)]
MLALHQPRALQLAALIHFALSTSFFIANATPLGNDALTLTARHDEAVCFKGFAWYCASLASACSLSIQDYSGPEKVWYSLPCVVGAICAGNTELVGGLCCMGTVPNCAQDDGASVTRAQNGLHDMPLDIQSMLNGWNGDEPFSKGRDTLIRHREAGSEDARMIPLFVNHDMTRPRNTGGNLEKSGNGVALRRSGLEGVQAILDLEHPPSPARQSWNNTQYLPPDHPHKLNRLGSHHSSAQGTPNTAVYARFTLLLPLHSLRNTAVDCSAPDLDLFPAVLALFGRRILLPPHVRRSPPTYPSASHTCRLVFVISEHPPRQPLPFKQRHRTLHEALRTASVPASADRAPAPRSPLQSRLKTASAPPLFTHPAIAIWGRLPVLSGSPHLKARHRQITTTAAANRSIQRASESTDKPRSTHSHGREEARLGTTPLPSPISQPRKLSRDPLAALYAPADVLIIEQETPAMRESAASACESSVLAPRPRPATVLTAVATAALLPLPAKSESPSVASPYWSSPYLNNDPTDSLH